MNKHLTLITLTAIFAFALSSTAGIAGGYQKNIAYGGSFSAHRYAFEPDPRLASKLNPTRALIPEKMEPAKRPTTLGVGAQYPVGSRVFYRQFYEGKDTRVRGKNIAFTNKLGTTWPQTVYNQDRGKGRELSRIFKP